MFIKFTKIKYKNFLSTGNRFTEIDLIKVPKTVIHGTNGSGKTTFVDALYFALYGKSFRKVKKDSVVNYITKKNALVELDFTIRKDNYKIIRGVKPATFEIYKNDKLVPKDSTTVAYQVHLETFIIHMNEKMFTQTVLLGSTNYTPFMLLGAADRRNVIESLLDIQIFTTMNDLAKGNNRDLTRRYTNIEYEIEKADIKIDGLKKHINSVKGNRDVIIQQNLKKIDENQLKINSYIDEGILLNDTIHSLEQERGLTAVKDTIDKMITSLDGYVASFTTSIRVEKKSLKFYDDNDNCPTCAQIISDELKLEKQEEYGESILKFQNALIDAQQQATTYSDKHDVWTRLTDRIDDLKDEIDQIKLDIKEIENTNKNYQDAIDEINSSTDVTSEKKKMKEISEAKDEDKERLDKTSVDLINYETVLALLKDDGIKTRIVKTYIPVINTLIKKYLEILEFPIIFRFDEAFNEYIKVRGRDEVTFPNLSEGERMRVNLSLIFSFRELAKLRNATHCNLIIFDEVADSSLDNTGWDSFLKILNDVCSEGNQNTFIISHKGDQIISKFDRDIKFAKVGGRFSEILV